MARYKLYKYDQMVMVPISFQNQLEPGTLEHTLHELVEHHIDLSVFEVRYQNDNAGARAIHPKLLLKVILFAYSRGMVSARQIERACWENIVFMALSSGYRPDHSTLAHFVSSLQKAIESVFGNILLVCDELDLLGGTHFSLEGVKLSSNASKEWSGTCQELKKKRDKLQAKLQQVIAEHIRQDGLSSSETARRQQQEKRLRHQVERLNEFLQEQEPKEGKAQQEIQSNVTDNQSAKMPTSHGVIQGYNAQALVDSKHQVIVHAEACSSQDHENLAPMLVGAKRHMQSLGKDPDYFKGSSLRTAMITVMPIWHCARQRVWRPISPTCSFANEMSASPNNQDLETVFLPDSNLLQKKRPSPPLTLPSTHQDRCICAHQARS